MTEEIKHVSIEKLRGMAIEAIARLYVAIEFLGLLEVEFTAWNYEHTEGFDLSIKDALKEIKNILLKGVSE